MEHTLGLPFVWALFLGLAAAVTFPEDDIFLCRKNVFTFGQPYGAMMRNSSFVLSPHDKVKKIKITWPLVKMYMQVSGASFMICDTTIPAVDIVDFNDQETGHFKVTREGGSEAFGTITLNFVPMPLPPNNIAHNKKADEEKTN